MRPTVLIAAALSLPQARLTAPSSRAPPISAKITGAALAAAFAAKNSKGLKTELTLDEKEAKVIDAIRETISAGRDMQPRRVISALGDFGGASGTRAQTWLTPQQCERVVYYWWAGWQLMLRDVRRGRVSMSDVRAVPAFLLLFSQTFPWTPLLVPLVERAVTKNNSSSSTLSSSSTADGDGTPRGGGGFVPSAFDERRLPPCSGCVPTAASTWRAPPPNSARRRTLPVV